MTYIIIILLLAVLFVLYYLYQKIILQTAQTMRLIKNTEIKLEKIAQDLLDMNFYINQNIKITRVEINDFGVKIDELNTKISLFLESSYNKEELLQENQRLKKIIKRQNKTQPPR